MRNSTHNKGNKTQHAHNMSMFSLKNAKSMKLQRYGNWIAYYDADNPFAIFWYNHETTQSQWETPLEVMEWQERHHSSSNINIFDQVSSYWQRLVVYKYIFKMIDYERENVDEITKRR